ncbi:MAG: competence/damage-inducible protein A, partial [bacterium]
MTPAPTAILMPIGNELLNGRVVDSNSAYAAGKLYHRGIVVQRIVAIPDDLALIAHEIQVHRAMADLLITSGGIGATADDLTRQAVALAFDLPLERNEEAVAMMTTPTSGYSSAARWRMADLPRGCTLIPNPVTKAPGFIVENVYVLPGVPELFRLMFDSLEPGFPGRPMFFAELYTFRHEGEYAYLMDDAVAR